MQRSVFEQLRYFSHLFYLGNAISDADYKTLVSLCIAIILLFSAWLVILVEVLIYSCRHHLRKNRNVVSHADQLDASEMTQWDSAPEAVLVQSHKMPVLTGCNKSIQTEFLLNKALVAPERPSHRLPPINIFENSDVQ